MTRLALTETARSKTLMRLGDIQFVRFVLVGGLNTGFSYLVYVVLLFAGLEYAYANLGAMLLGILFSFRTQGRLVFDNTDIKLLGRFVFVWVLIYLLAIFVIGQCVEMGLDAYTAGALALPVTSVASYFAQKYLVFPKRGETMERNV